MAIETLAVRGAPAIGVAAAYGACSAPTTSTARSTRLARTRPTAVNLQWALDRMREAGPDPLATAHAIAEREEEATRLIAQHGAELLHGRVITHCNTGLAGVHGRRHGARRHPRRRRRARLGRRDAAAHAGRAADRLRARDATASRTASSPTRAPGLLMARDEVDAAIVGADRIAANGDVANKIGTYSLAVLAKHHGVPFYVAAPTSTIDPAIAHRRRHPDRGARARGARHPGRAQLGVRRHARTT